MNNEQIITDFIEAKSKQLSEVTLKMYKLRIERILSKIDSDITNSKLDAALYMVTMELQLSYYSWQVYYAVLNSFKNWYFGTENK